jgi:hypothetical protein
MKRINWRLMEILSLALAPEEREAVYGDLAESGASGAQAIAEVFGLVARRQGALWQGWRPWLVLLAVSAPLAMLLSLAARTMASESALPIWMYSGNWTRTYLTSPGARMDLLRYGGEILLHYGMLFCWSWIGGLLLRCLSLASIPVQGSLFSVVLLFGEFFRIPQALGYWMPLPLRAGNHPVFASTFYRAVFPAILFAVLVVIPFLWGIRQGARLAVQPSILWVCAAIAVTALATENWTWWLVRTAASSPSLYPHLPWLLPIALLGPIGYRLATSATSIASSKETKT